MISGMLSLAIALLAAVAGAFYYFMATKGQRELLSYGRWAVYALAGAATIASAYLLFLILSHQYQVAYVYSYTASDLPLAYLISAFWAGQEGSFLLWVLFIAWLSVALIYKADRYEPQVMVTILLVQAAFLVMLLARSPFTLLPEAPIEGAGLNPLLQNPWMAVHPPLLFMGYAGLVIPFAYAIAALWKRDYKGWAEAAWPWTIFAWGFLGAGIAVGGYWAYETLGWGGYWGWDPVENSSLVPWLTATALAHGLITQKARGTMGRWNLFLAAITFSLVLYATFLTRSGVLSETSVHSFVDSGLGPLLILAVILAALVPLGLLALRLKEIPGPVSYERYLSREFAMLLTILVLLVAGMVITVGTSTPIFTRAALRADFYNVTTSPLALILAATLSLCPLLGWRETNLVKLLLGLAIPGGIGLGSLGVALLLGVTHPLALLAVGFGAFATALNLSMIVRLYKAGLWKIGGYLAHAGLGLMLVGIVGSAAYSQTEQLRLAEGQSGQALGYTFTFHGLSVLPGTNKAVLRLSARRDGESFIATPTMFQSRDGLVRNPHIQRHLTEDIYISPGDYIPGEEPGEQVQLAKGQSQKVGDYTLTFLRFATSPHEQTGAMSVAAVLQVTGTVSGGIISPTITADATGLKPGFKPKLPGSEATVALESLDASGGIILLRVEGLPGQSTVPQPAVASFEVSRKPAINLLWGGTILLIAGTAIAVQRRRLEATRAVASLEGPVQETRAAGPRPVRPEHAPTPKAALGVAPAPGPARARRRSKAGRHQAGKSDK